MNALRPAHRTALALFALALAVQFVLISGWREEGAALAEEQRRVMREQRAASRKLSDLQRRAVILQKAGVRSGPRPAVAADSSIQAVRGGIVRSLGKLENVRLDVHVVPPPAIAEVGLSANGEFFELLRLISTLARPESGLVVQRLILLPAPPAAAVRLEAAAVGGPAAVAASAR